jgi:hypothetical protein
VNRCPQIKIVGEQAICAIPKPEQPYIVTMKAAIANILLLIACHHSTDKRVSADKVPSDKDITPTATVAPITPAEAIEVRSTDPALLPNDGISVPPLTDDVIARASFGEIQSWTQDFSVDHPSKPKWAWPMFTLEGIVDPTVV